MLNLRLRLKLLLLMLLLLGSVAMDFGHANKAAACSWGHCVTIPGGGHGCIGPQAPFETCVASLERCDSGVCFGEGN